MFIRMKSGVTLSVLKTNVLIFANRKWQIFVTYDWFNNFEKKDHARNTHRKK